MLLVVCGGVVIGLFCFRSENNLSPAPAENENINQKLESMTLASSAFQNQQSIPSQYSCQGEDINPPLQIEEVPSEAKTLALIVDDPDAPGQTWDHWILWDIPVEINFIQKGTVPDKAVQGINSFKKHNYGGPCPPSGIHHYHFKLYALNTTLSLVESAGKAELEQAMAGHILQEAELIGLYQK